MGGAPSAILSPARPLSFTDAVGPLLGSFEGHALESRRACILPPTFHRCPSTLAGAVTSALRSRRSGRAETSRWHPGHHRRRGHPRRRIAIRAGGHRLGHAGLGDFVGVSSSRINSARCRRRQVSPGPAVARSISICSSIRGNATRAARPARPQQPAELWRCSPDPDSRSHRLQGGPRLPSVRQYQRDGHRCRPNAAEAQQQQPA